MSIFSTFGLGSGGAAAAGGPMGLGAMAGIGGINALLSFLGGHAQAGRMDDLREQLMKLFSPNNLMSQTNTLFGGMQRSPMYSNLRNTAMEGSTQLGNQLQTSFARAGLGRSGIAAAAMPMARASTLGSFQGIDSDLFMKALSAAQGMIGNQANALTQTMGASGNQIGFGNTLQSLQPLLLQYFMSRMGGGTNGQRTY